MRYCCWFSPSAGRPREAVTTGGWARGFGGRHWTGPERALPVDLALAAEARVPAPASLAQATWKAAPELLVNGVGVGSHVHPHPTRSMARPGGPWGGEGTAWGGQALPTLGGTMAASGSGTGRGRQRYPTHNLGTSCSLELGTPKQVTASAHAHGAEARNFARSSGFGGARAAVARSCSHGDNAHGDGAGTVHAHTRNCRKQKQSESTRTLRTTSLLHCTLDGGWHHHPP